MIELLLLILLFKHCHKLKTKLVPVNLPQSHSLQCYGIQLVCYLLIVGYRMFQIFLLV